MTDNVRVALIESATQIALHNDVTDSLPPPTLCVPVTDVIWQTNSEASSPNATAVDAAKRKWRQVALGNHVVEEFEQAWAKMTDDLRASCADIPTVVSTPKPERGG